MGSLPATDFASAAVIFHQSKKIHQYGMLQTIEQSLYACWTSFEYMAEALKAEMEPIGLVWRAYGTSRPLCRNTQFLNE